VGQLLDTAKRTGARVHVLHVSSADVLPLLAAARADGDRGHRGDVPALPHPDRGGRAGGRHRVQVLPPRSARGPTATRLWGAIRDGGFVAVVSDHSPCTADLKGLDVGDFAAAWGGIASLQLGLSTVWTEARARGLELADVVALMAKGPADLVGLARKGRDRPRLRRGPGRVRPRRRGSPSTRPGCTTATPSPRTPAANSSAAVHTTWLAGTPVDVHGTPRGAPPRPGGDRVITAATRRRRGHGPPPVPDPVRDPVRDPITDSHHRLPSPNPVTEPGRPPGPLTPNQAA